MPNHLRLGLKLGALIILLFLGLIGYSMRTAPRMLKDSQSTLDTFYANCRNHDYVRARQLMAPELKDSLSVAQLADRWQQFEKTNGKIQKWLPAAGGSITFGGRVCLFPPFVDYTHKVVGQTPSTMATATVVYVRLVPRNGTWQLQKLSFMR